MNILVGLKEKTAEMDQHKPVQGTAIDFSCLGHRILQGQEFAGKHHFENATFGWLVGFN